jgi:shikimate 5-dehydrogenase
MDEHGMLAQGLELEQFVDAAFGFPVIPFLDEISAECRLSHSVNTVIIGDDGSARGDSTDGYGLEAALRECLGV